MSAKKTIDNFFLVLVLTLTSAGFLLFLSASLGVLAKDKQIFISILLSQFLLGIGLGLTSFFICARIPVDFFRKYSFWIFLAAVALSALVYIPGVSLSHGGAQRWISLGPITFQPAEFLKLAVILYAAGWLSVNLGKKGEFKRRFMPLAVVLFVCGVLLLFQPDTKSFVLISITLAGMLFLSGIRLKYILALIAAVLILIGLLFAARPYLLERFKTYLDPSRDAQGSSYQIRQSLIAIGAGGLLGRGPGQSVQKFSYLPEAQGDSIFAVIAEEFGFVGGAALIVLFLLFALRGLSIARATTSDYSRLVVAGFTILITAQAFLNIASITGVAPLTGVPLPFVSHGGSALFITLLMSGIILSASRRPR